MNRQMICTWNSKVDLWEINIYNNEIKEYHDEVPNYGIRDRIDELYKDFGGKKKHIELSFQ